MNYTYLLWLLVGLFMAVVQTRVTVSNVPVGLFKKENGWLFLDRMSFDEGKVSVKLNIKIKSPRKSNRQRFNTFLHIIPDYQWSQQVTFKCDRDIKVLSTNNIVNNVNPSQDGIIELAANLEQQTDFELEAFTQFQISEPVTYHFVFKDCEKNIVEEPWRRQTKIDFRLEVKNGDLDYGSDQRINSVLLPFLILATIVMMYFSRCPSKQEFLEGNRDLASLAVFVTLIFNLLAIVFYWIGHLIYTSVNGRFYTFFDFMYLLFHAVSQSILTCLILFVAYGWTIAYIQDAQYDLYLPLTIMLGIINLILTLLGKISDGTSQKYHMYDTIPSYILVLFRVVSVGIMLYGIISGYMANSKHQNVRDFYLRFGILGAIYFLSLPVIMILAKALPQEQQKIFVFITVQLLKNSVNAGMTWMVYSKKSKYSSAKLTNRSFMEQGNKLL